MSDRGKYFINVRADYQRSGDGNVVTSRELVERRLRQDLVDKISDKKALEVPPDPTVQGDSKSTLFLSLYVMTPEELNRVIMQEIGEYLLAKVAEQNPKIFKQRALK